MQKNIKEHMIRAVLAILACVILAGGIFGSAPADATAIGTTESGSPVPETADGYDKNQPSLIQAEREEGFAIKQAAAKPEMAKICVISLKTTETGFNEAARAGKAAVKTAQETARNAAMKQAHEAADAVIRKEKEEEEAAQAAAQQEAQAQQESTSASQSAAQESEVYSTQLADTVYIGRLYVGGYAADVYSMADYMAGYGSLAQAIGDQPNSCYYDRAINFFGDHNFQGFTEITCNNTATMVWADGSTQTLTKVWQGIGYNTGSDIIGSDGSSLLYGRSATYLMYTCTPNSGGEVYVTWWN